MAEVEGGGGGGVWDARDVRETETGSVPDNPRVFAETEEVLSGGNFHGAPVAFALDYAAIVLTDLAGIRERRIERLINPDLNEGLPPFLTTHPGTASGYMVAQITAVALINEMKRLSIPARVGKKPNSYGKEDHVAMGMTGARKERAIAHNPQT